MTKTDAAINDAIRKRKERSLLRWRMRETVLETLNAAGVKYTQPASTGPGSGVAYIDHPEGRIVVTLATAEWRQGVSRHSGMKALLRKLTDG